MKDPIERQDAIDAMTNTLWHYPNECYRNLNEYEFAKGLAELGLKSVPSAQPDIIHCEDCIYGVHSGRGDIYLCTVSPEEVREHKYDFYCGYADRRTD